MYCYLLLLISLHQTCGVYLVNSGVNLPRLPWDGGHFPLVYSRDIAGNDINVNVTSIEDKISEIIEKAESDKGISTNELKSKAKSLQQFTQSIMNQRNIKVSDEEVNKLLNEVAAQINVVAIFSPLISNPFTYEAHSLNVTLQLLEKLRQILHSQQASDENYETTLAAIVRTCELINNMAQISEDFFIFIKERKYRRSLFRRQWSTSVNAGYDKSNGFGASGGLHYSKGNFQAGLTGGWNERQGANVNAGFTWRF